MKPKISAIITTHNRLDVLPRAIRSVLYQTYENIELIVVSDGSVDGTDDYMKIYEGSDNIRYISYHPSMGGNHARNIGIINATGQYVAFLDDDDEWLPKKIERQVEKIMDSNEIELIYVGKKIIYSDYNISYNSIPTEPKDPKNDILIRNFIGATSSVMVKRNRVLECGMFDENLKAQQDYDLWIRLCQRCKVDIIPEPLINYYNYLDSNQVSDKTELYEESIIYIDNKYKELIQNLSYDKKEERECSNLMLIVKRSIRNNIGRKARIFLIEIYKKKHKYYTIKQLVGLYIMSYFSFRSILFLRKYFFRKSL